MKHIEKYALVKQANLQQAMKVFAAANPTRGRPHWDELYDVAHPLFGKGGVSRATTLLEPYKKINNWRMQLLQAAANRQQAAAKVQAQLDREILIAQQQAGNLRPTPPVNPNIERIERIERPSHGFM